MSNESDLDDLEAALRAGLERSGVGASVRWEKVTWDGVPRLRLQRDVQGVNRSMRITPIGQRPISIGDLEIGAEKWKFNVMLSEVVHQDRSRDLDGKAVGGQEDVEWLADQWLVQWLGWEHLDRWPRSGPPGPR